MSTARTTSSAGPAAANRLSVLLIDSRPDRTAVARLLRHQFGPGVRIYEAADGRSALEILRNRKIDVALVDDRLPDMSGLELLDEMAGLQLDTAAVLMAGHRSDAVAATAVEQGSADCVLKRDTILDPDATGERDATVDREAIVDRDTGRDCLRCAVLQALRSRGLRQKHAQTVRQLRRTHQELDHFVRALSHDMSASFMLLESSFSQLKDRLGNAAGSEPERIIAHLEACLGQSKRFLNDLVQLGRTGTVQMDPGRVDVAAVVDEVLFEHQELIAQRRVEVDVRRPLPFVWCNRQRVKQIVTNLVRNAIRHGCDPQQPKITIGGVPAGAAEEEPPEGQTVLIRIHDNGPGVEPQLREEIFLPGRRLPRAADEGSGMGLAIVRKIARHYGGSVGMDPDCPAGTAMLVRLPAVPDPAARGQSETGHPPSTAGGEQILRSEKGPPQPHRRFSRRNHRLGPH